MKILYQNRDSRTWIGGDSIKLEKIMEGMKKLGFEVGFSHELVEPSVKDYDLVHVFNLTMGWTKCQIQNAINNNKPYVISAIYHGGEGCYSYTEQRAFVKGAKSVIVMSEEEKEKMRVELSLDDKTMEKFYILMNGIDDVFFEGKHEQGRHYVMTAGRFEHLKNFKATAKACKRLGYPLLVVGEPSNQNYIDEVKNEYPELVYIEAIDRSWMPHFYKHAKVYCLLSDWEVLSYSMLEASASGCNIVYTDHALGGKKLPFIEVADIKNEDDICAKLKTQWEKPNDNMLSDYLSFCTWKNHCKKMREIYSK